MLTLALPWLLLLWPLPLLTRRWLRPWPHAAQRSLYSPALLQRLADSALLQSNSPSQKTRPWLGWLLWSLLLLALARPQWLGEPIPLPQQARNLYLALDLSDSMQLEDMRVRGAPTMRLEVARALLSQFIEQRRGDRLGLILFGEHAYVQAPLTFDQRSVAEFVREAELRLAGRRTAIGEAIGLAIKRLREQDASSRVLILLTDGRNTAGSVSPEAAAQLAQREGIRVYTIGLGSDSLLLPGGVNTDLDEESLQRLAQMTGGRYFRARSTEELAQIYRQLDQLEPVEQKAQVFRPVRDLFQWPLGAALLLLGAGLVARHVPTLRQQRS